MSCNKLKFLNHSSFLMESDHCIFLCDPWYQNTVFFNGWDLVSKEFTNNDIINLLISKNKKIHIWYSHEHPDHFSINFLNEIKDEQKKLFHFHYKKTADVRVINFLKKKNFQVNEAQLGENIEIDNNMSFKIFNYKNTDDSFSITKFYDKTFLNLNDCAVKNKKDCEYVSNLIKLKNVDYVFAQFSYATWRATKIDRENVANEKLKRLSFILNFFQPKILFPFASYIYFSHEENFFMNDSINFPTKVMQSVSLTNFKNKILFLKPLEEINLDQIENIDLAEVNNKAIKYWDEKFASIKNYKLISKEKSYSFDELKKTFNIYRDNINKNFFSLNKLLEKIGIVKELIFKISDNDDKVRISYLNGISKTDTIHHIECSSEVLHNIFKYEYGWDSIKISGRFNYNGKKNFYELSKFFFFQNRIKNGQTMKNSFELLMYLLYMLKEKVILKSKRI